MKFFKYLLKGVLITIASVLIIMIAVFLLRGFTPFAFWSEKIVDDTPETYIYKEIDGIQLEVDYYAPNRNFFKKAPLLIYVHGGSWKGGTHKLKKSELDGIFNPIRDMGISLVSVQYRLTDESTKFPDHINDLTDAIRYMVTNSDEFNIDKKRVALIGASAGAHLNLLAALAQDEFHEEPSLMDISYKIRGVISIAAPLDLVDLSCYTDDELVEINKLLNSFIGETYIENPEKHHLASPASHISENMPPILMIHGEFDRLVPVIQADNFYDTVSGKGAKIEYIRVENAEHSLSSIDENPTVPDMSQIVKRMAIFLLRYLLL